MEKTTFTIGEVSEMFDLPISTIRYYDKQHLLPNLKKTNGIRSFDKDNIEAMRVIQCLKASGLEIREIQTFMELCQEGNKTFAQRKAIFEKRREVLEENIRSLERELDMIKFKCWYYDMAQELEDEEAVKSMIPDELPEDILPIYLSAHECIISEDSPALLHDEENELA